MKTQDSPGKSVESAIRKVRAESLPTLEIRGGKGARDAEVLTPEALGFVAALVQRYRPRLKELLKAREPPQARFDQGELPGFRDDPREIRDAEWRVGEIP